MRLPAMLTLLGVSLLCLLDLHGVWAAGPEKAQPYRVYYIGNSLTDCLKYDAFQEMVESSGQLLTWGRKMIPGAPIIWHWDHPRDGFAGFGGYPEDAFAKYSWDAMTLQPFIQNGDNPNRSIIYALKYTELLRKTNPHATVYIYAQWVGHNDEDWFKLFDGPSPVPGWSDEMKTWPELLKKLKDVGYTGLDDHSFPHQYEATTMGLRLALGENPNVYMIPSGQTIRLLGEKMRAGLVPGTTLWQQISDEKGTQRWECKDVEKLTSLWQLYNDSIHINNIGSYLVGCTYYATMFKKSPVGVDFRSYTPTKDTARATVRYNYISKELADMIAQTAWEVVATEPLSGVTATDPLKVVTPGLPEAYAGRSYSATIRPAFGKGPWTWTGEKLPDGLTLGEDGRLKGMVAKAGDYTLSVKVTDSAKATANADLKLHVAPSTEPVITMAAPKSIKRGNYSYLPLSCTGGNGIIRWKADAKTLPKGMKIISGALLGAPGAEGVFDVKLTATDSDPDKPQSTTSTLTLQVAPAAPETMLIAKALAEPKIDGILTDGEWDWDKAQTISKVITGAGIAKGASFAALWSDDKLYIAVKVPGKPQPGSRITLYIDPSNSHEVEYNSQHNRIRILPDGTTGKDTLGGDAKKYVINTSETVTGGVAECALPWATLMRDMKCSANTVIGLDVAIDGVDADQQPTRIIWRGSLDCEKNPATFGTAIIE